MVLSDFEVASWVISAGAVIAGAVVSTTVIFCVAFAELPEESIAIQVTMVSPNGNDSGASLVIVTWPTVSVAVGCVSGTALSEDEVASKVMSDGAVIDGAGMSVMVMC